MNKLLNISLVVCLLIFLPMVSQAQDGTYYTIQDFETWTSIDLRYKPTKKLRLSLSQQLRLKDNTSTLDVNFTQLGLKYKLADFLSIGFASRLIIENDNEGKIQGNEKHLRWHGDIEFGKTKGKDAYISELESMKETYQGSSIGELAL